VLKYTTGDEAVQLELLAPGAKASGGTVSILSTRPALAAPHAFSLSFVLIRQYQAPSGREAFG